MKWISFPCGSPSKPNNALAEILISRAIELGYEKGILKCEDISTCALAIPAGEWTSKNLMYDSQVTSEKPNRNDCHAITGDLNLFLFSKTYEYVKPKNPVIVKLNNEYKAEVTNKTIKVGCQTFDVSKLTELTKAIEEYNKQ